MAKAGTFVPLVVLAVAVATNSWKAVLADGIGTTNIYLPPVASDIGNRLYGDERHLGHRFSHKHFSGVNFSPHREHVNLALLIGGSEVIGETPSILARSR